MAEPKRNIEEFVGRLVRLRTHPNNPWKLCIITRAKITKDAYKHLMFYYYDVVENYHNDHDAWCVTYPEYKLWQDTGNFVSSDLEFV